MTFSIVACDLEQKAWGVAVASKFPAVGAVVPWAQAGVGAVATQSFANTSFGPRGLAMMATGLSAEETLSRLLEDDIDKELRQVGLVDAKGGAATFTGTGCFAWAGGLTGKGFAIQGNILKSERVAPAMERAFLKAAGSLPERLHAALLAGDRAGGDKRGRQSAAIYVVKPKSGYGGFTDRWIDYR
ncbi:MAG TPA: fimbrial assembly protein FimA, partial [Anaerolineae bacterium]|nr:fimbrial assembly protein FimA [Anaerolineae bacterium]